MKEETGFFTSFDGTKLFFRAREVDAPNALVIVHGFGEHSGRYHNLVEAIKALPLSVYSFDLRGHGQSEGPRVCVDSFDDFTHDVAHFRSFIEAKRPGQYQRFILYGQSFGGLIASATVMNKKEHWDALILLSPFLGLPFGQGFLSWLAKILNPLMPRKIWNNPIRPILLTRDLDELKVYKSDKLIQRRISICLMHEMFEGVKRVEARASELTLPVLVLAAGEDRIVSTPRIKQFFEHIASKDKELHVFDGFYHEIFHELGREKPLEIFREFLKKQIAS